jgi:anti-sigma factor RsiW
MQLEDQMDCKESCNLMPAYVDNELDSPDAIKVASHIAGCAACTDACEEAQALRIAVRDHATHYQAPSHLRHRIQTAIDKEKSARRKKPGLSWAWINFGVATAFSFAFALTLVPYLAAPSASEQFDQELIADHYRSLMANHLIDIESSDRHTVKPWFTGKLDFSPPVHDLAQQGFPLIGGRLDYLNRQPAAALAYRHGKHLINLFVLPDRANKDTAVEARTRQGFQLVHWAQSGMAYWLVSDMSLQELIEFQRLLSSHAE